MCIRDRDTLQSVLGDQGSFGIFADLHSGDGVFVKCNAYVQIAAHALPESFISTGRVERVLYLGPGRGGRLGGYVGRGLIVPDGRCALLAANGPCRQAQS